MVAGSVHDTAYRNIQDLPALRSSFQQQLPENADCTSLVGISNRRDKFVASCTIQGFSLITGEVPTLQCAWANRVAMVRVRHRVCAWLNEDRPDEDAVTDGEFAAFLRGVLEEVRATSPDILPWKYYTEIWGPVETQSGPEGSIRRKIRVNSQNNLGDALWEWRKLRQQLGIAGKFNYTECAESLRNEAEHLAKCVMSSLPSGGYPTDSDALHVLRLWAFPRNTSRVNVIPEGKAWVASDTLGLIIPKISGCIPAVSKATLGHEAVFRLLRRWVQGRLPDSIRGEEIPCTSMSINKGYAAKLHRDGRNAGPAVAASIGEFSGGRLMYWPSDDRRMDLEALRSQPHVFLDTKKASVVFDGNLGHAVEEFSGERFSVILFTCSWREKVVSATKRRLQGLGVKIPTDAALLRMRTHLPDSRGTQKIVRCKSSLPEAAGVLGKNKHSGIKHNMAMKVINRRFRIKTSTQKLKHGAVKGVHSKRQHMRTKCTFKFPWRTALTAATKIYPEEMQTRERLLAAKRIYGWIRRGSSLDAAVVGVLA